MFAEINFPVFSDYLSKYTISNNGRFYVGIDISNSFDEKNMYVIC